MCVKHLILPDKIRDWIGSSLKNTNISKALPQSGHQHSSQRGSWKQLQLITVINFTWRYTTLHQIHLSMAQMAQKSGSVLVVLVYLRCLMLTIKTHEKSL